MDSEQNNTIPLFLRRVGNSDKSSSTNTMKKLVFPGEGSDGGAKNVCPEIKVNDFSCSHTVSETVLLSPSRKNRLFTMGIKDTDEIHGRSSCNRIVKGSLLDDQRKTSGMAMPSSFSPFTHCVKSQENKDSRNAVHPRKKLFLPNANESVSSTSVGCSIPMITPLDEEEQSKPDNERPIQSKTYHSPFDLPRTTEKNSSSFLKVYQREGSSGYNSDSDSSANNSPSGFFKTRFHYSGSSSSCGSISGSSTSTTPGISPSGDFKELTWFDDPFSVNRRPEDMKSKPPLTPCTPSLSIENELQRWNLSDKTSPPKIPDTVLTPIEIEARQRYERRVKRKQERECRKEERFFF